MAEHEPKTPEPIADDDAPDYSVSDVFRVFTEPFLRGAREYADVYFGYLLASLAWNLSYLPPHERIRLLMRELQNVPDTARLQAKQLIGEMITRKEKLFAQYDRWILDFSLDDRGSEYYLTVRSAPMNKPPEAFAGEEPSES